MDSLLYYTEMINPNFALGVTIFLILLFIILLIIAFSIKSPKTTKTLFILSMISLGSWLMVLALLMTGVLPIHEENYINCGSDCIGVVSIETPTLFTKIAAALPFSSLTLIVVTLISRQIVANASVKRIKKTAINKKQR